MEARETLFRHTLPQQESEEVKREQEEHLKTVLSEKESADFHQLSLQNDPSDIRDFKAFMPLLKALRLHLYDRNNFSKFDLHKSL